MTARSLEQIAKAADRGERFALETMQMFRKAGLVVEIDQGLRALAPGQGLRSESEDGGQR